MVNVCEVCLLKEWLKRADSVPKDCVLTLNMSVILYIVDYRGFCPPLPPSPPIKRMMTERYPVFERICMRKPSRRCAVTLAIFIVNNCIQYTHKTSHILAPFFHISAFEK